MCTTDKNKEAKGSLFTRPHSISTDYGYDAAIFSNMEVTL